MDNHDNIDQRLRFIGLDDRTRAALRAAGPFLDSQLPQALDRFYDTVRSFPETKAFFSDEAHIAKAKQAQIQHWRLLARADFNADYVAAVRRIGRTHARIGLAPNWYIGGYAAVVDFLVAQLFQKAAVRRRAQDLAAAAVSASALVKAAMLDMDFVISIYLETAEERRQESEAAATAEQQRLVVEAFGVVLEQLSAGDLTVRVDAVLPAGYETLRANFNEAVARLRETLQLIVEATGAMHSGVDEIRHAADDLSGRTERQAATLEQTAAALDQITATVQKTASGADQALMVATKAKDGADRGGEVVGEATAAMQGIEQSSRQISQIIGVIDEIAFQTNLLALNAGVEAARAGDAGRGFAVVASEVRQLAQRSAEAAKEIKALIAASSDRVSAGVDLVARTGEALNLIAAQVGDVNAMVWDIAASAKEQAVALHQVNVAVNQMDQVTQQNAAMVEQSTAASHALTGAADQVAAHVARFTLLKRGGRPELKAVS
jgi:methyl-accepting chemotaxis protein